MVLVSQLGYGFIDLDKFSQFVRTFNSTQVNQTSMMLPRLYLMINDSWLPKKTYANATKVFNIHDKEE